MSEEDVEKEKGNAAFHREDYASALKHYNNAIQMAGSGAGAALFSNKAGDSDKDKGNTAFRKEDYATALKHYDNAIRNAGGDACAALYANKAAALLKLKKYDLCVQQCLIGLAASGLTPELKSKIYFRLGCAYEAEEKLLEAMEAFKKCEPSQAIEEKAADLLFKLSKTHPGARKFMGGFFNNLLQHPASDDVGRSNLTSFMHRLNLEKSGDTQKPSRSQLISDHNRFLEDFKKMMRNQPDKVPFRFDTIASTPSGHVCTALLCDLKSISIDQLRLHAVNIGKILICRTITEPVMLSSLATIIEDPKGEVTRMAVYNICSRNDDFNTVLPCGTYLAIKEPWYKTGAMDSKPALRVDNPADLIYLEQSHHLLKNVEWQTAAPVSDVEVSWEPLQKRGNEFFVAGKYELAIAAYTDAIELKRKVAPKEVADLLSNRAAAYLGDDKPTDAFWDCQSALYVKPGHLKATFRLAKAFGKQGKYEEAKEVLEKSPHTTRREFQDEISRLGRLILEKAKGQFDLKSLLKEAAAGEAPHLDHADYNAGVRKQWISRERGNGLVALRGFAPGDLIILCKAFEATYNSECSLGICVKAGEMYLNDPSHNECVSRIIRRISKNADLIEAGLDDALAAVDSKRVAAIVDQNAFGSSDFETEFAASGCPKIDSAGAGFAFGGCGVWILPSFMNHSCVPNTVPFYVGDLMIVRAAKHIRKGEELTTSYVPLSNDYQKRQEALKKYAFECECALCVCDLKRAADLPLLDAQRQTFIDSFEAKVRHRLHEAVRGQTKSIAKVVEEVRRLADEFASRLAFKNRYDASLARLYCALGYGFNGQRQWLKAAQAYEKAYFATAGYEGNEAADMFIHNTFPLDAFFHCYNVTNNALLGQDFAKSKEYLVKMRQAAKICWGSSDQELLEMLYPGLPMKHLFEALI